jgi:AraC-like DNA-binding protein
MFKKFQVEDLLFVEYHCLIDELRTGFWTPCNYVIYILTGKKSWKTADVACTGNPGDAIFLKKGAYVADKFLEEEFCSLIIFLPDAFIRSVMLQHNLRNQGGTHHHAQKSMLRLNVDPILESYFMSVFSYFPHQTPPPTELLRVKFEEFVIHILSTINNPELSGYFEHIRSSERVSVREIMEENFTHNMKLEEYARLCGRSLSTFRRDFQKTYHTTPSSWLLNKRLEFAKVLLETTDGSVADLSFESGFENTSHFIRAFKSKFGTTPLKYRHTILTS